MYLFIIQKPRRGGVCPPMTTTAHLLFRRSCATEKSQKTINGDPSALRFVGMTNNTGNKAKTYVLMSKNRDKKQKLSLSL